MTATYPKDLDLRDLTKYDGSWDLQVHVSNFKMEITVKGFVGSVIPQLFAGTLQGAAQIWFHSLPLNSI